MCSLPGCHARARQGHALCRERGTATPWGTTPGRPPTSAAAQSTPCQPGPCAWPARAWPRRTPRTTRSSRCLRPLTGRLLRLCCQPALGGTVCPTRPAPATAQRALCGCTRCASVPMARCTEGSQVQQGLRCEVCRRVRAAHALQAMRGAVDVLYNTTGSASCYDTSTSTGPAAPGDEWIYLWCTQAQPRSKCCCCCCRRRRRCCRRWCLSQPVLPG